MGNLEIISNTLSAPGYERPRLLYRVVVSQVGSIVLYKDIIHMETFHDNELL